MHSSFKRILLSFGLLFSTVTFTAADDFQIAKTTSGVEVTRNGKLMTRYLVKSGAKPILWPLIGPNGN